MLTLNFSNRQLNKIIVNNCNNIYLNLAKELDLLYSPPNDDQFLYLWRNSPVVVIGKHQNPYKECNLKFMKENSIVLSRRPTGGGAVYQDLGNSCWTFISPKFNPQFNNEIIIETLKKFNINSIASGRNDIEVNGKKVSGSAFRKTNFRSIHHGTMIMNVNMTHLVSSLTVDSTKLIAKGVESVRSRVMNLHEINNEINHQNFCETISKIYEKRIGKCEIEEINEKTLLNEISVKKRFDELISNQWIFNKSSTAKIYSNKRFDFGGFDIILNINENKIKKIIINSDCLYTDLIEGFENTLNLFINNNFNEKILNEFINSFDNEIIIKMAKELINWIIPEMKNWNF